MYHSGNQIEILELGGAAKMILIELSLMAVLYVSKWQPN
jgi:hypothetical protein